MLNKLSQCDENSPPNTNGQAGLNGVATLPSWGVSAVLNQVVEHIVAALDKVCLQAAFNLGDLVVVLVADGAVSDFAGTA